MWIEDEQIPHGALFWYRHGGHVQMLLFYVHIELNYGCTVSFNYYKTLQHGYSTRSPWAACCKPRCITQPAVASVNCAWIIIITQWFGRLGTPLIKLVHVRPANQPAITGVVICYKEFGDLCCKATIAAWIIKISELICFLRSGYQYLQRLHSYWFKKVGCHLSVIYRD